MLRLFAWLSRYRATGWFTPSVTGRVLPMPASWQGGLAFCLLILVLAVCAAMGPRGAPIGILTVLLYGALAYWTLEKAD